MTDDRARNVVEWRLRACILLCIAGLAGCSESKPATLYRNSVFGADARILVATFNANEGDPGFNIQNCSTAALMWNANMQAFAEQNRERSTISGGGSPVGFWCEIGAYKKRGSNPGLYPAKFPVE